MAEKARQEPDHGPRHPRHLDQQPKEDEQRDRKQDQVAHPLVHAADQDNHRQPRRQRQVAERGDAEGEGDRHPGEHEGADKPDEEQQQVVIAEWPEEWSGEVEGEPDHGHGCRRRQDRAPPGALDQPEDADREHQDDPQRQGGRAPGVRDLEGRGRDGTLLQRELERRPDREGKEPDAHRQCERLEERTRGRAGNVDQRGHPHMFRPPERDDRAQHREPQEQDGRELIRPDDRAVEDVAADYADEQDQYFREDQQGGGALNRGPDATIKGCDQPLAPPHGAGSVNSGGRKFRRDCGHGHPCEHEEVAGDDARGRFRSGRGPLASHRWAGLLHAEAGTTFLFPP